jgi:hypothetical protein
MVSLIAGLGIHHCDASPLYQGIFAELKMDRRLIGIGQPHPQKPITVIGDRR